MVEPAMTSDLDDVARCNVPRYSCTRLNCTTIQYSCIFVCVSCVLKALPLSALIACWPLSLQPRAIPGMCPDDLGDRLGQHALGWNSPWQRNAPAARRGAKKRPRQGLRSSPRHPITRPHQDPRSHTFLAPGALPYTLEQPYLRSKLTQY